MSCASSPLKTLKFEVLLSAEGSLHLVMHQTFRVSFGSPTALAYATIISLMQSIVSDQIERESNDAARPMPRFLKFLHRTVLVAPTDGALNHHGPAFEHHMTFVPRSAFVDGAGLSISLFSSHAS